MMDHQETQDLLERALSGDSASLRDLVDRLTPVVQKRVARALLARRYGAASGREVRQEVDDLSQEVFLTLFAEGGRVLRTWEPDRGLSLPNFVGLVAQRRVAGILRNGKKNPWRDEPTLAEDLDRADDEGDPEEISASRELLHKLLHRLREELTPLAWQMFDLLFLHEMPPDLVARKTSMSKAAVYKWQSRLYRFSRRILAELSNSDETRRRP